MDCARKVLLHSKFLSSFLFFVIKGFLVRVELKTERRSSIERVFAPTMMMMLMMMMMMMMMMIDLRAIKRHPCEEMQTKIGNFPAHYSDSISIRFSARSRLVALKD